MRICQKCDRRGGCGCLWASATLCKKCDADAKGQPLPMDIEMEMVAANTIEMHVGQKGLGDAVCAFYAAAGLALTGRDVILTTGHHRWFEKVTAPGVVVETERPTKINVSGDYYAHLKAGTSRKQWYCDSIAKQAGTEPFHPSNSFVIAPASQRPVDGDYVVLSPFSAWQSRSWPLVHWKRLCELLSKAGLTPVVLDSAGDGARIREMCAGVSCKFYWGQSPQWVTDVIQGAQCVVGNDSGIPHVAGLLGAPTVAIHAHLKPEHVFSHTGIVSATPDDTCAFCAWQRTKGYGAACDSGCSALMGISAQRVFDIVMKNIAGGEVTGSNDVK